MARMEEIDHLIYGLEVSLVDRKFLGYVQYVQSKQCEEIINIEMPEVDNPLCISLRKEVLSVIEELRRMQINYTKEAEKLQFEIDNLEKEGNNQ